MFSSQNFRRHHKPCGYDSPDVPGVVPHRRNCHKLYGRHSYFGLSFETASAIGTVGLTLGITTELGFASRLILIVLMFWGRVGGLTLVFAAISGKHPDFAKFPMEKITVG